MSSMSLFKQSILTLIFLVLLIFGTWLVFVWYQLVHAPLLRQNQTMVIKVPHGTGVRHLSRQLYKAGLLKYPRLFTFITKINGDTRRLKAGEYQITENMTAFDLLNNIVAGKVMQHEIVFIEGWTFREYKETLADNTHLKHTINKLSDLQIMAKLGHPKQSPEGLFFPDTYFFIWGETDLDILKEAYQRMQTVLRRQWVKREEGLPYKNAYQALIVASLIEKETAMPQERKLVSGVILRRLKKRMRLQIDPTVLYGLGRTYRSRISKDDLALYTRYNTYRRYHLPPTPIDMPGKASIVAALHPAPGDDLYYVSKGDGSHHFSKTYREHRLAVEKYLRSGVSEDSIND